ncbi:MBOAT family O-acyltransferase [Paenibacillus chartarius]|uniref:MBOAT family O-acyltransferase n=1 Tax=Paenibacillus chartarius TaxID=747481 RepID=A0ABV6DEL5_9BACL
MFYLHMNAIVGLAGMIAALMLTRRWPSNKRVLLLLFNLGFLYVFSQKLFVFNVLYVAGNYALFLLLCRIARFRLAAFVAAIAANIGAVTVMRLYGMGTLQSPLFDVVITLGLIYNVLKVIDALYFAYFFKRDGEAGALDYANYILFIPTFTSGPILKFRDFMADTKKPYQVDAPLFEDSVKRIILGLFKKMVLVPGMSYVFQLVNDPAGGPLHTHESLFLMVWFYLWIYLDFSGYSDIAIGFGRLLGYTMPENFKKPFTSPSLTQFWRNWHVTLGDWFRDHIFIFFSRRTPSRLTAAGLSLLIMLLMGLWHGFTWLYVLYGLYHGVIIALESYFELSTVNKKKVSVPYYAFRVALTQLLVIFGVIVYSGDSATVLRIYEGLLRLPSF